MAAHLPPRFCFVLCVVTPAFQQEFQVLLCVVWSLIRQSCEAAFPCLRACVPAAGLPAVRVIPNVSPRFTFLAPVRIPHRAVLAASLSVEQQRIPSTEVQRSRAAL